MRRLSARSPYDTLIHEAKQYQRHNGRPDGLHLVCWDEDQLLLPAHRYEAPGETVTCLACLVTCEDGET